MTTTTTYAVGDTVRVNTVPGYAEYEGSKYLKQEVVIEAITNIDVDPRYYAYFDGPNGEPKRHYFYFLSSDCEPATKPLDEPPAVPDPKDERIKFLEDRVDQLLKDAGNYVRFLERLNSDANTTADDFDMCEQYEDRLDDWNNMLTGYGLAFKFLGRTKTKKFRVTRERIVYEYIDVEVECNRSMTDDYWAELAEEQARNDDDWEFDYEDDNGYDTREI